MERRTFVKTIVGLFAIRRRAAAFSRTDAPLRPFPITAQLSPVAGQPAWQSLSAAERQPAVRAAIDAIADHGFTGIECPLQIPSEDMSAALRYIKSRGLYLDYDRTIDKGGGVDIFVRDKPSPVSVFSPEYAKAVRERVQTALAEATPFAPYRHVFLYQDEPFHAGPASFDYGDEAKTAFNKRFGYDLPPDVESARKDPKVWQDVIEFRTSQFPAGWRQVYRIIKELSPSADVVMTHDSHSTFGAGVGSNSKMAVDDVFHWGADFADTFVFDIYPHMMLDYRYGDCGVLRQPRFSQMHYALAHMRNLAYTHAKQFGFWFGTFNQRWFKRFMSPDVRATYWAERETSLTAVAHGANFLISGYDMPEDGKHWASLGEGLQIVQQAGPELLVTRREKAKACFLFPRTQYVQLQEEYWNVGLSFELFLQAFGELDVIHEDQLTDSRIGGYPILTMFDVKLLPDEIARRLEAYVRAGGIVIADCVPNLDRYGRPSETMSRLFGVRAASTNRVKRTGVWVPEVDEPHWFVKPESGEEAFVASTATVKGKAFDREFDLTIASPRPATVTDGEMLLTTSAGAPALVRRKMGKGRTYLLGFCVQDSYFQTFKTQDERSRDELLTLMRSITHDAGVHSNVSSSDPEVEAVLRADNAHAFLFVINHGASDTRTTVRVRGASAAAARIEDVADGREVAFKRDADGVSLTLDVRHDEPKLFRIRRRR